MGQLNSSKQSGVTWLDAAILVVLLMFWFLIARVWEDPLAGDMFSLTGTLLSIYLISRFTGFLGWIKFTVPTWTISGLVNIPIWAFYLSIIPVNTQASSSTLTNGITEGILSSLFSPDTIVRILQIYLFPITESLFVIFLLAFFIGLTNRKTSQVGFQRKSAILPMFIVGAFGGLIHTAVATKLKETGVIDFTISLWQQFLSFFIFAFMGIIFMAPGVITSHVVKNLIIFGDIGWWILTLTIFVFMDVLIIYTSGPSKNTVSQKSFFT